MAVSLHEDMSAFQQVAWNVEGSVGDVVSGRSGVQIGHILLETRDKGVWLTDSWPGEKNSPGRRRV